jgi:riboflavin kinase
MTCRLHEGSFWALARRVEFDSTKGIARESAYTTTRIRLSHQRKMRLRHPGLNATGHRRVSLFKRFQSHWIGAVTRQDVLWTRSETTVTILHGRVVSGVGNFGYWIERLRGHYLRKTGMDLFPGTLNLELDQPWSLPQRPIRLEAEEYGGAVSVNLVPCTVFGRSAFILRTDANEQGCGHHPRTIIEIATDVKLREAHHLHDGDIVEVRIP